MSPTISIIIPVYNVADYLTSCIDSIINQGFKDYEVLLVDDGSSDNSGLICDEYAKKDDRIKVLHKSNGGVSSARNLGIEKATGEWLYFIDSDDEILPNALQLLVNNIESDVDVVSGGYLQYVPGNKLIGTNYKHIHKFLTKEEGLLLLLSSQTVFPSYLGYLWIWMFRSKIIRDNSLWFDTKIKIKEDTLFVTQFFCLTNRPICFDTTPIYKYKSRDNSVMMNLRKKYCPDYYTSLDAVIKMHSSIQQLNSIRPDLSNASKYEVMNRVYLFYGHMVLNNAFDDRIFSSIKHRAIREVGIVYYIRYQYHRNKRRAKKLFKRLFTFSSYETYLFHILIIISLSSLFMNMGYKENSGFIYVLCISMSYLVAAITN